MKLRSARLVMIVLIALTPFALVPGAAWGHDAVPPGSNIISMVSYDQHLDAKIPGDLTFRDENDREITFSALHAQRPVLLALSYFACETLCPLVRQGVLDALRPLGYSAGKDFEVVFVSIDPMETAAAAQTVKQTTLSAYDRAGSENGFHFLRADHQTIDRLADAVGFRYAYDGVQRQYAHPAGILLVTPQGLIARYFFGVEYAPQDLRLGLVEASNNKIGTPIDRLLLLCYHYDPAEGKYSFLIMNVVRMAGILMVAFMGIFILVMRRKEAQRPVTLG